MFTEHKIFEKKFESISLIYFQINVYSLSRGSVGFCFNGVLIKWWWLGDFGSQWPPINVCVIYRPLAPTGHFWEKPFKIQCGPVITRSTSFKMLKTDIVRPWRETGQDMGCLCEFKCTGHWFRWRLVMPSGNRPSPELMLAKLKWFLKYHPNFKLNNYRFGISNSPGRGITRPDYT